jgi:hypothetical protein
VHGQHPRPELQGNLHDDCFGDHLGHLEQPELVEYVHQSERAGCDLGWVSLPVGHVGGLLGLLRYESPALDQPLSMAGEP